MAEVPPLPDGGKRRWQPAAKTATKPRVAGCRVVFKRRGGHTIGRALPDPLTERLTE